MLLILILHEMLVTPESSFPTYEVTQTCMLPSTTLIILDSFQVVILLLLAIQCLTNTIKASCPVCHKYACTWHFFLGISFALL